MIMYQTLVKLVYLGSLHPRSCRKNRTELNWSYEVHLSTVIFNLALTMEKFRK